MPYIDQTGIGSHRWDVFSAYVEAAGSESVPGVAQEQIAQGKYLLREVKPSCTLKFRT